MSWSSAKAKSNALSNSDKSFTFETPKLLPDWLGFTKKGNPNCASIFSAEMVSPLER